MESFHPPRRTLMGPGPSDVSPRVLAALARPTIGHLDPEFIRLMDEIKQQLQYAFRTTNELTLPVSAPGSAGMEAAFVNLLEPGDTVIVCQNGVFGGRMQQNVERCGAEAVMVVEEWGRCIDLEKVAAALQANPGARALAFVHAETSTGVRSDAAGLCALAREHGCLSIVDAVTSLGGIDVDVDGWGIDAVYSGTQKCLSCVPGMSPVSFSPRAVERIRSRRQRVQSWFLDMNLIMDYWGNPATQRNPGDRGGSNRRSYHHTAPVNNLYALHESLLMLQDEGLETAWSRHARNHQAFVAGIEAMGLQMLVEPDNRLPQLNTVCVPAGVDEAKARSQLLVEYGLEIGAGLGTLAGRVWRIGLMGFTSTPRNVFLCLHALEQVLGSQKAAIKSGVAIAAARKFLAAATVNGG